MIQFLPFPEFATERLLLRRVVASDWKEVLFLRSDLVLNQFITRAEEHKTKNKADAMKFIDKIHNAVEDNISVSWGITLLGSSEIIGTICLWNFSKDHKSAEVGYDLSPVYHKKGIMTESLKLVLDYGFGELNLDKIEAFTHRSNVDSRSLLEKNGFEWAEARKDDGNANNLIFEILAPFNI